ncbi:MAG: hypothetical protein U9N44_03860 [Chloroflexota bacterium]|nr:hypothetical protein [Chloroflexota bacterium]
MRFWSKGLGDRELIIDLSRGNLTNEPNNEVIMRGIIAEPVNWNYEVTLFDIDARGILRVAISFQALIYFAKNIGMLGTYFARLFKRDFGDKEYLKKTIEEKEKAAAKVKASQPAS